MKKIKLIMLVIVSLLIMSCKDTNEPVINEMKYFLIIENTITESIPENIFADTVQVIKLDSAKTFDEIRIKYFDYVLFDYDKGYFNLDSSYKKYKLKRYIEYYFKEIYFK